MIVPVKCNARYVDPSILPHVITRVNIPLKLYGAYMDVSQKISTNGSLLSTFLIEKYSPLSYRPNSDLK
jgi:hypothetical protein